MFTVKAEIDPRDGLSVRDVALFAAHQVRVKRHRGDADGRSGPQSPRWDLELYNSNQELVEVLPIGAGLDHYCVAYVINEHGKTVDRVIGDG